MGFVIETVKEKPQERAVNGCYWKAAVGCWFTSTGRAIPMLVKYEDEDGIRHMLKDIHVRKTEQKYYAGILSRRYECTVTVGGQKHDFTLLYHPETGIWDLVLPETIF